MQHLSVLGKLVQKRIISNCWCFIQSFPLSSVGLAPLNICAAESSRYVNGGQYVNECVFVNIPTPSLRLCNSSVSGAVAPSASMASAASLSWASSHRTPAATRWMFSMGEYNSCTQTHKQLKKNSLTLQSIVLQKSRWSKMQQAVECEDTHNRWFNTFYFPEHVQFYLPGTTMSGII